MGLTNHWAGPPDERLNSWKEIAAYLRHSERTVRRWQSEGLPVHRHTHKKRAGVYAYKPELDAWWNSHTRLEQIDEKRLTQRRRAQIWIGAAILALVLLAGTYVARKHIELRANPAPRNARTMVVVLPFENFGGDQEQEYFSDGLTEEMISRLGQVSPHRLGVIARTTAMQYEGKKQRIDEIGKDLGVDYAIEGTVRHEGDLVRVSAQLIHVSDQTQVWAKSYDGDSGHVLQLQEKIAQAIVDKVEITLTPEQEAHLAAVAPVNAAAHEAYLKGRWYLAKGGGPDLVVARDYFSEATTIDPRYAPAFAGLAETYNAMNTMYLAPAETEPQAEAAATKALELDESLAEAHVSLGRVRLFYDWNWPEAEKEFLSGLDLNPNLPQAHLGYAQYLTSVGRFPEAVQHVRAAYALDPLSTSVRIEGIRLSLLVARQYKEAVEQCRKAGELPPNFTEPFGMEAFVYVRLGRFEEAAQAGEKEMRRNDSPVDLALAAQGLAESGKKDEARELLRRLLETAHKSFVCGYNIATVYAALGQKTEAFHWLDEGIRQRSL